MDFFNLSESPLANEGNEMTESNDIKLDDQQSIILENQRLKELNSQLQNALTSTQNQLKDALNASACVNSMTDQINHLRQQINQSKTGNEKQRSQILEISEISDHENAKSNPDNFPTQNLPESQNKKLQKYKTAIKLLRDENENQKKEIENSKIVQNKLLKKNSKLKSNLKTIAVQLKQSNEKIEQLQEENRKLEANQILLEQDKQNLNNQLKASVALGNEKGGECDKLKIENNEIKNSYNLVRKQVESQSDEIKQLNQERQTILQLLNRVNMSLLAYESTIESIKNENENLKKKSKPSNDFNLDKSEIPFDGELRAKCLKILMIDQYTPSHKMQLILNAANESINQLAEQLSAAYKEQDDTHEQIVQERKESDRYKEMMKSLLKELKNVALIDDKINKSAFCENDTRFIDFVAEKSSNIDNQIASATEQESNMSVFFSSPISPAYGRTNESNVGIPINFFANEDQEKTKEVILRELKPNDLAFSMFVSQFLLNTILKKQIQKLNDAQIKKEDLDRIVQEMNGVDIFELPKLMESLKEKVKKITAGRKEEIQKLQEMILEKNKNENELKIKIEQLQLQNDNLKNECNLLNVKNQVATNELLLNSASAHSSMIQTLSGFDGNEMIPLKNDLNKTKEENSKLKETIQSMQNEINQQQKKTSKELKKNENEYIQQIRELQQQLQEMNEINSKLKKKYKKAMKLFQQKMDQSQIECQQKIDESRQTFKEATDSIREKQNQSNELTQKLVQSLKESEESKQKCQTENSDLIIEKKNLQVQMSKLQEEIKKERQNLKGQLSALQIACDSRIQDVVRNLKQESIAEKEKLYSILIDKLSNIYKIDCYQFDDDSYIQLIDRVKDDLEKTLYLQNTDQFSV